MAPATPARVADLSPLAVLAILYSSVGLCACSEPSIRVHFELPDDYRSEIRSAVLRVLEPTGAEPFDCDDIAFDRVSDEVERAAMRQEVVARADGSLDLSGIPRLGDKLFWMRALDADNRPILAGCQAFGDISGQASVTVVGEPTTVVTTDLLSPIGAPLPDSVELFVTDTAGRPLSDVEVTWTVVTASDGPQTGIATTASGAVTIAPERPAAPGPAVLDIRARWQEIALPPISGFETIAPMLQVALPGSGDGLGTSRTAALYTVGPIGPSGQMGFAALGPLDENTFQRQLLLAYYDGEPGGSTFRTVVTDPIDNLATFASIGRLNRGVRDVVVVSSGTRWHEVALSGDFSTMDTGPAITKKLFQAGSCERDSDMLLAVVSLGGDDQLVTIAADGATEQVSYFADPSVVSPLGAGCVSAINGEQYRTIVFQGAGPVRPFVADIPELEQPPVGEVISFANTIGFVPAVGEEPAAFLGVNIDIDGASISRYQLAVGPGELEPLLIAEDPSLTFVRAMRGGDIDGDQRPDVAALLDFGIDDQQRSRTRLQLVMGTEYLGKRLIGVSQELSGTDPLLFVADFNNDGSDDMLLADRDSATILPGITRQ